jgi:hypothetical protein
MTLHFTRLHCTPVRGSDHDHIARERAHLAAVVQVEGTETGALDVSAPVEENHHYREGGSRREDGRLLSIDIGKGLPEQC